MAILDGVSAFRRCACQRHFCFRLRFFCSCWNPRLHCSGDESTSQFPLDAVGAYDLKIVVPICGITSMISHSSGNSSRYPFTGPFAHTVP